MKSFRPYQIVTAYFPVMRVASIGSRYLLPAGYEELLLLGDVQISPCYGANLQQIKSVPLSSSRLIRPVDQTAVLPVRGSENSDIFPLAD